MADVEPGANPGAKIAPGGNPAAGPPDPGSAGLNRILLAIAAVPALAITYYYGYSLPAYNRARLEIDRQQIAAEQKRAGMAAQDAASRKQLLEACMQKASDDYFTYLRLNGSEKDGKISASSDVEAAADQRRRSDRESCARQYAPR
jgi:hypothetical protein